MTNNNSQISATSSFPPSDWVETTLGEVCEIIMGQSPKGETYNIEGNGLPFYQGVTEFDEKFVRIKTYTSKPTKIIKPNTILFSVRAPVGRVNFTKYESCIGRGNAGLNMNNGNQEFLFYLLKYLERQIQNRTSGTVFTSISSKELKEISIIIPSNPAEQKAIASILSAFDDKIELLREQNKTLEEIGQTIYQEWFGKYSVDDLIKAQEVLEFDKGIEVGSNNYYENKNELENPEMFYRVGDIVNNGNNSSIYCEKYLLGNKIFNQNEVMVSFDGTVGRVFIGGHGGYSSGIRKIFDKNGNIKNSFLYFWAKSKQVQETINLYSEGTTIQHAGKSIPYLEIISNQEHINQITENLNPIFTKILDNLFQIQTLARTRDELLPKLMSGEVRVKF